MVPEHPAAASLSISPKPEQSVPQPFRAARARNANVVLISYARGPCYRVRTYRASCLCEPPRISTAKRTYVFVSRKEDPRRSRQSAPKEDNGINVRPAPPVLVCAEQPEPPLHDRRLFPTLFVDFFAGPLCLLVQIGKRSAQTLQTRMRTMGENVDIDFQN